MLPASCRRLVISLSSFWFSVVPAWYPCLCVEHDSLQFMVIQYPILYMLPVLAHCGSTLLWSSCATTASQRDPNSVAITGTFSSPRAALNSDIWISTQFFATDGTAFAPASAFDIAERRVAQRYAGAPSPSTGNTNSAFTSPIIHDACIIHDAHIIHAPAKSYNESGLLCAYNFVT